MTYRLVKFGTVDLPLAAPQFDAGTAGSQARYVQTATGQAFDAHGTDQAPAQYPYELPLRCEVIATSLVTMRNTIAQLRQLRGKRQQLWRALNDDTQQWAYARLLRVPQMHEWNNVYHQPIDLQFMVETPWYGTAAEVSGAGGGIDYDGLSTVGAEEDASIADGGSFTVTLPTYSADVTDLTLTLTAGSLDITAFTLTNTTLSMALAFTGTITAGDSLIVDTGAWSVTNGGADAWADLTPPATEQSWLRLTAGANVFTIAMTGGSTDSTLVLAYYETWE